MKTKIHGGVLVLAAALLPPGCAPEGPEPEPTAEGAQVVADIHSEATGNVLAQVFAFCEQHPDGVVRAFVPRSGEAEGESPIYRDFPCGEVLGEHTHETVQSVMASGEENIGEAKEPLVLGFICDAALAGLETVAVVPLPWSLFFTIGCITAHFVLP
ncbi:MAG: hypothetical protein ABI134_21225 [Byssovorax sp.]